ncbi:MAG TPA: CoA transferase [Methylomirabilota bacterium]|nr:CoA transferase [Methylomirabilota bacterium]
MSGPLAGLRVVDLSRIVAGPLATQILGDYGADVVKVEVPGTGDDSRGFAPPWAPDGSAAYFFAVNRNKRSIALNLKQPREAEILRALAARADVLVENFTPGTMEDLGLGWERLRAANPRLVYCAISGFGASGPDRARAGYDTILQAVTGLMSITGEAAGPPVKTGVALIDEITALYAHGAILAALRHRDATGHGQKVECSLLESGVAAMLNAATNYLIAGTVMRRWGSAQETVVPYQAFRVRDGYLVVGAANDRLWRRLCETLGAPEWADDPRFATNADRVAHREALVALIEARLAARDRAEWLAAFARAGLPAGPINTVDQVFADPQVLHRGMVQTVQHPTAGALRLVGIPVKFSDSPGEIRRPPPRLGEHTAAVLREWLGLSDAELAALAPDATG